MFSKKSIFWVTFEWTHFWHAIHDHAFIQQWTSHIQFLPRASMQLHLLLLHFPPVAVPFFPIPLTHWPGPAGWLGSSCPGQLRLLCQITKLMRGPGAVLQPRTLTNERPMHASARKHPPQLQMMGLLGCSHVAPVLQAGSAPHPEKQNFKTGSALEFRHLNYLNLLGKQDYFISHPHLG